MSTSKEVVEEKIPRERPPYVMIIAASLLLGIFGTAWNAFQPGLLSAMCNFGSNICTMWFGAAPFYLLVMAYILSRAKPLQKHINLVSLTYLYAIGAVAFSWVSNHYPWYGFPQENAWMTRVGSPDISMMLYQMYWAPSPRAVEILIIGNVSPFEIPWAEWAPVIVWYTVLFYLHAISYLTTVNIFRRWWIDVERIPFPAAIAAHEFLKRIPPAVAAETEKERGLSPFLIGVILGAAFEIPIILASLLPWFPDIYGWRVHTCAAGNLCLPPDAMPAFYSSLVGMGNLGKNPAIVAIAYFAPLNVLFTGWFFYVIMVLLVQALYIMGYYTGLERYGSACRSTWSSESPVHAPPLIWAAIELGGLYMIAIMEIFMARHYLVQTIRKAFGKKSELDESNEPGSYRLNWTLFIVSNAILIGLWMVDGLSLPIAILLVGQILIHAIAQLMFVGTAGTVHSWYVGSGIFRFAWPSLQWPPTIEQYHAVTWAQVMTDFVEPTGSAITGLALPYRVNSLMGMHISNENLFKTMMIALLIMIPVPLIMAIILRSAYGMRLPLAVGAYPIEQSDYQGGFVHPSPEPPSVWLPHVILGALIVIVLRLLSARFIWFPFSPTGFLLSYGLTVLQRGLITAFFFGWLLKWLTLRMGGSRLYENYGMPVAAGFIVGFMATNFFGGIVGVYRFFFPF